jgi:hypothetical protein
VEAENAIVDISQKMCLLIQHHLFLWYHIVILSSLFREAFSMVYPDFHSVPLHHINLKSDFVSGQVVVGLRPTLPVEDISLLFGIDMAGDKVNYT